MNLTKTQKTFVGILHFAPIIGIFLYGCFFWILYYDNSRNGKA
jgi:hypothetical protein